jgi:hypothetical protein
MLFQQYTYSQFDKTVIAKIKNRLCQIGDI